MSPRILWDPGSTESKRGVLIGARCSPADLDSAQPPCRPDPHSACDLDNLVRYHTWHCVRALHRKYLCLLCCVCSPGCFLLLSLSWRLVYIYCLHLSYFPQTLFYAKKKKHGSNIKTEWQDNTSLLCLLQLWYNPAFPFLFFFNSNIGFHTTSFES